MEITRSRSATAIYYNTLFAGALGGGPGLAEAPDDYAGEADCFGFPLARQNFFIEPRRSSVCAQGGEPGDRHIHRSEHLARYSR